ncbi:MAG TPA: MBL fold metallo-hydrolase [Terriglobia bacterium]|nr:MBL fold metallo-hydrolase [Terriglobia bacterium]
MMRRTAFKFSIALAWLLMCSAYAQQNQNRSDGELHILPVQGNIYMLIGAGANITVSVGFDGTMLVDTGSEPMTDRVLAAVKQLAQAVSGSPYPPSPCVGLRCPGGAGSGAFSHWGWSSPTINTLIASPAPVKPIRYIINTSVDADHTGGNAKIAKAGVTFTGGNVARGPGGSGDKAEVWAFETVLNRMTDGKVTEAAWPTDTYYTNSYKWNGFFNGEGIQLFHVPGAHTDGDTIVYFRYSDVISAGEAFSIASYPTIDVGKGGSVQGTIDGLNKILEIAIPQFRSQGGTYIIPGHGRLCDEGDVANYRNMVVKVRDRVQDMIKSDMTLQQIKAARPTLDYDGRYGSPDAFIESVYRSLTQKR